ncbi:MAG: hypothetical protein MJY48_03725 [Bacteroidales bacterium]|nr:hypothetical protein [Bacteroidales bacterium]
MNKKTIIAFCAGIAAIFCSCQKENFKEVENISFKQEKISLKEGETMKLSTANLVITPPEAKEFLNMDKAELTSDNTVSVSVETAASGFVVKALFEGSAKITMKFTDTHGNVKTAAATVEVGTAHEYVDLGLSVKWAVCNIGAETAEASGDYFAWGETAPKEKYETSNYAHCEGEPDTFTKYCTSIDKGRAVDSKTVLESVDDAATVLWGENWRMPTKAEYEELVKSLEWSITMGKTTVFTGTAKNGGTIVIPAAGYKQSKLSGSDCAYYWSSTLVDNNCGQAYYFYGEEDWFDEGEAAMSVEKYARMIGLPVRPVRVR